MIQSSRSTRFLLAALLTALSLPSAASAETTLTATGFKTMTITDWGFSGAASGTSNVGGGAGSTAKLNDVSVSRLADSNSPEFFRTFATGRPIDTVAITVKKGTGKTALPYMRYCFNDVRVSAFDYRPLPGDQVKEELRFNFSRTTVTFTPTPVTGTITLPIKFGWDLKTNSTATTTC